jgi:hypothetical protein
MDRPALVDALASITGSWSVSKTRATDLEEARQIIANALAAGTPADQIRPTVASIVRLTEPAPAARLAIETLVSALHPYGAPGVRPFVRSELDLDPALRESIVGMKIERTLGPFVDRLGIEHFVDLLPIRPKFPIEGTGGTLALLVLDRTPVPPPGPGPIHIGAGTLWVGVRALVGGAATGFVGLELSDGTVEAVNVHSGPGGSLVLKEGSKLTMGLTLLQKAVAGGPSPIGRDAAALKLTLPAHVTLVFEAPGAAVTAFDNGSATLYGTSFTLTRNGAKPRVTTYGTPHVLIPCTVSIPNFAISTCASTDFVVKGSASVKAGGWALPIATSPPADLGVSDGAGVLALELGPGIAASFGSLPTPTPLADITFVLNSITILSHTQRELHERFPLWGPPPAGKQKAVPEPIRRISDLDVTYLRGALITTTIAPGRENVTIEAQGSANLDRPLAADGSRLPLDYTAGFAGYIHDASGRRALLALTTPPPDARPRVLVLENALIGTAPSTALAFLGTRVGPSWVGRLAVAFPLRGIVPTLPDPYAASFGQQQLVDRSVSGSVTAMMQWTAGTTPDLNFTATNAAIPIRAGFTLLDVSTNADQFGVSTSTSDLPAFSIAGMALETMDRGMAVYALPGISWEPIVRDVPPAAVNWLDAFSNDDGPPTLLRTATVDLVRVEPKIALPHFQAAANKAVTRADFTLPFGIMAHLATDPNTDPRQLPIFQLNDTHYSGDLRNSLQLSIIANTDSFMPHVPPDGQQFNGPALPGSMGTGSVATPPNQSIYGVQVISATDGPDPAGFFDQQFTDSSLGGTFPGIPVARIDLSGYGTSMYSDWRHDDIRKVGVVRARFEVVIGRTAYEMLVFQTAVCPWCFRMTRTLLFERYDTGLVIKHDTGWKPIGLARFEILDSTQVLSGAMASFSNIHNVQLAPGSTINLPPPLGPLPKGMDFTPVTFDADLNINSSLCSVSANGKANVPVACTRVQGYAQATVGDVANKDQILALMTKVGPAGVSGLAGCIVSVGAVPSPGTPQFTLNVSSIQAAATSSGTAIAVALNGTPRLPRDGAWSISKRARTAQTPTAVAPTMPVPLVLANSAGTSQWRLLDPADADQPANPATFYGIMQGSGSSKTLFEHTIIDNSGSALNIDGAHLPNLADIGALLGASDIFPNLGSVLQLNTSPNPLNLAGDGFKQIYDQDIVQPDRTIFQLGIIKIVISYKARGENTHVTFRLDPAISPRWSLDIKNVSFLVMVDGFGSDPLLTFFGDFSASETKKPSVDNIDVAYGSALGFVQDVFSGLSKLIELIGGGVDLHVGFSLNHLTVRNFLALPTLPLGFGDIHDVVLDLGFDAVIPSSAAFHVGLGAKDKPFTWLVSPLSGTGAIVIGVENGDIDVFVEAGIGAGLEINLAIARGAASITLEVAFEVKSGAILVTMGLLGQAEVDVLGGLASASLTLAASITIEPRPPLPSFPPDDIELTAAVAVGIHISICWVISVDFDGSFQFSQDVPVNIL